MKHNQTH